MSCRLTVVAAILTTLAYVAPASASALTYCVSSPACVAAGGTPVPDVDAALNAPTGIGVTTVDVGPGTYPGTHLTGSLNIGFLDPNPVNLVGAGVGQTILMPVPGTPTNNASTLRLLGAGSSVSDLTVMRGSAPGNSNAIELSNGATVSHVAIAEVTPASPAPGFGIQQLGGDIAISDCSIVLGGSVADVAVNAASSTNGTVSVDRCVLASVSGVHAGTGRTVTVEHSTVTTLGAGVALSTAGTMTAQDDLLLLTGPGQTGIAAVATAMASAVASATGVTVIGGGADVGFLADGGASGAAFGSLNSSIVRGPQVSLKKLSSGSMTPSYSDYDATATSGTISSGPGVINVDPQFVSFLGGDYHLRASSPLLDQGDPALPMMADSSLDLDGAPRSVHGRIDMGAYEYGRRAPIAVATATPATATTGAPVGFDGSGSHDPDAGDSLTYAWTFDDGATATGAAVTHAFSTAGVHLATLTVSDPIGLTGTAQATATIVVEPTTGPPSTSAPPGSGPGPEHSFHGVLFVASKLTLNTSGKVGVRLQCPASTARDCRGTLMLSAKLAASKPTPSAHAKTKTKTKAKATRIGSASFTIAAGKTKTVSVTLSAPARRAIARAHRLSATGAAVAHDGNAATHTTTKTLSIVPAPTKQHHAHH